jgi:hypothetical protein
MYYILDVIMVMIPLLETVNYYLQTFFKMSVTSSKTMSS